MTREPNLLLSTAPTAIVRSQVNITHVQLRDLIICPRERGVVNYTQYRSIVEHNILDSSSSPRTLAGLSFTPTTLTSLPIGDSDVLVAAGGQEAEIHLSYYSPSSSRHGRRNLVWQFEAQLNGTINNSVFLTSLNLGRSNSSYSEPRVGISNNDCSVTFYDVPIHGQKTRAIKEAGSLHLDVPVNHSSVSPDGRTLLSVGDSNQVYLHYMSGSSRITFSPICTLTVPPPVDCPLLYPSSSLAASFSTAFSADGIKFAVASQEGVVAVWDVRSSKPLKTFQTDKSRLPMPATGSPGWVSDDPWEWTRGNSKAPGWSVRSVKFNSGSKEVMAFTEHTSKLHVVDARTFETEEIISVPSLEKTKLSAAGSPRPLTLPRTRLNSPRSHSRLSSQPSWHPSSSYIIPVAGRSGWQSSLPIVQVLSDAFRIPSQGAHVRSRQRSVNRAGYVSDTRPIGSISPTVARTFSPPASISDSTWRTLRRTMDHTNNDSRARERDGIRERETDVRENGFLEDVLVIPPLGDRDVESEVHAVLSMHGIASRTSFEREDDIHLRSRSQSEDRRSDPLDRRREEVVDMDVEEPENDCISTRASSRSSSPSPSARTHGWGVVHQRSETSSALGNPGPIDESTSPTLRGASSPEPSRLTDSMTYEDELDLAGICFDPSGGWLYAASKGGVVEWSVRGAEKRWSFDGGWR